MLGPYWIPSREDLVTRLEQNLIAESLRVGYSVIIDATNLNPKNKWGNLAYVVKVINRDTISVSIKDFTNVPIETCIERDKLRPKEEQVGEEVIRNMRNKYLKK